jgi:nucleoside-diphosphate-sugar epimerase
MSHHRTVLVTGANGYIGARTIEAFLKAGYSVRGSVRSKASAKGLLDALSEYAGAGRLEIVEVPDITALGAFDKAAEGV